MAEVEAFDLFSNSIVMVENKEPSAEETERHWETISIMAAMRIAFEEAEEVLFVSPEFDDALIPSTGGLFHLIKSYSEKDATHSFREVPSSPPPASNPYQPRYWVAMNQPKRRRC